jgi:hypothetical protein
MLFGVLCKLKILERQKIVHHRPVISSNSLCRMIRVFNPSLHESIDFPSCLYDSLVAQL